MVRMGKGELTIAVNYNSIVKAPDATGNLG